MPTPGLCATCHRHASATRGRALVYGECASCEEAAYVAAASARNARAARRLLAAQPQHVEHDDPGPHNGYGAAEPRGPWTELRVAQRSLSLA